MAGGLSLPPAGHDGHSTPSPVLLAKDRTQDARRFLDRRVLATVVGGRPLRPPRRPATRLCRFSFALAKDRALAKFSGGRVPYPPGTLRMCAVRAGPRKVGKPAPHLRWRNFPGTGANLFCVDFQRNCFAIVRVRDFGPVGRESRFYQSWPRRI